MLVLERSCDLVVRGRAKWNAKLWQEGCSAVAGWHPPGRVVFSGLQTTRWPNGWSPTSAPTTCFATSPRSRLPMRDESHRSGPAHGLPNARWPPMRRASRPRRMLCARTRIPCAEGEGPDGPSQYPSQPQFHLARRRTMACGSVATMGKSRCAGAGPADRCDAISFRHIHD